MRFGTGLVESFSFEPIGYLRTVFKEKFGIPRQPGLVTGAQGVLKLRDDPDLKTAIKGLEGFSHLWVVFVFHEHDSKNWKPSIRPPRLGGAKRMGSLASRSPHRPNPIGLSAVKLDRIELDAPGGVELYVSGVDVLDETPILDIKPYLPYADSIPGARSGGADEPIHRNEVVFSEHALESLKKYTTEQFSELKPLITEMLALDPRPSFQKRRMPPTSPEAQGTRYGFRLLDFDVKWEIRDGKFHVLDIIDFVPGANSKKSAAEEEESED